MHTPNTKECKFQAFPTCVYLLLFTPYMPIIEPFRPILTLQNSICIQVVKHCIITGCKYYIRRGKVTHAVNS